MSRKLLGFGLVYSLLLIGATAYVTAKTTTPSAADAITQLEQKFLADPIGMRSAVHKTIAAADHLDGALLEHDVFVHIEEGIKLHEDNEKLMEETHVLLASMRKELSRTEEACDACGGTCDCKGACTCLKKSLHFLSGMSAGLTGEPLPGFIQGASDLAPIPPPQDY